MLHKGRKGEVAHSFLKDGNWWYKDTEEMTVMCNEKDLHIHIYFFAIFIILSYWTIDESRQTRVEVAELEVPQVEVAGLKVDGTEMVRRWYRAEVVQNQVTVKGLEP